jgi:hypothetical protein
MIYNAVVTIRMERCLFLVRALSAFDTVIASELADHGRKISIVKRHIALEKVNGNHF